MFFIEQMFCENKLPTQKQKKSAPTNRFTKKTGKELDSRTLKTIFQREVCKNKLHADFFISEISISYNETLTYPSNPLVKH